MIKLELPWPPTVNHYKRLGHTTRTKTGRYFQPRFNSPETKRFYYDVWVRVQQLDRLQRAIFAYGEDFDLEVMLRLHPPDNRRRDIDNVIKPIFDGLQRSGIIKNDYQIARLLVERKDIIAEGKVIVSIAELENPG